MKVIMVMAINVTDVTQRGLGKRRAEIASTSSEQTAKDKETQALNHSHDPP